jgi:hypothetical protein
MRFRIQLKRIQLKLITPPPITRFSCILCSYEGATEAVLRREYEYGARMLGLVHVSAHLSTGCTSLYRQPPICSAGAHFRVHISAHQVLYKIFDLH